MFLFLKLLSLNFDVVDNVINPKHTPIGFNLLRQVFPRLKVGYRASTVYVYKQIHIHTRIYPYMSTGTFRPYRILESTLNICRGKHPHLFDVYSFKFKLNEGTLEYEIFILNIQFGHYVGIETNTIYNIIIIIPC